MTIERRPIALAAVPYAFMLTDGIGYVRFTQFSEHGRDEIRDAVRKLEKQGMRSLVLDLRDNPGGPARSGDRGHRPVPPAAEIVPRAAACRSRIACTTLATTTTSRCTR